MSFVNERVSDEDIKKHGLDELVKKYNQGSWADGRPSVFTHAWTIDRDRGVFAILIRTWDAVGASGRAEPTHKTTWLLDVQGERAEVVVDRAPGSSSSLADKPYRIIWNLVHLDMSSGRSLKEKAVLDLLKEALTAYGLMGVRLQADSTHVTCNF